VPLLEGAVGSEEDPEGFVLTLTDSSGAPVETLPAGDYDIRVQDVASLHNFHLTGPGVDEATPIPGTGEVVWRVSLTPGDYTAVCDPHPDMSASFTVT
jgi:plastocyanin